MSAHIFKKFDQDLAEIQETVNQLANSVLQEFEQALQVFDIPDKDLANEVIEQDKFANQCLASIEFYGEKVLSRQHVVADDLRFILCSMRMAPRLERIGDYAKSMAIKSSRFKHAISSQRNEEFHNMHTQLMDMLNNVIQAYNDKNYSQADVVWKGDDELDSQYKALYTSLLEELGNSNTAPKQQVELLFIAKGLERAGDHISDIAKDVQFMVKGK
ncbi:phosphate signaling complex protein PhoU [Vibrio sp.]|uniref:phosphate signaling complex protein PhoU n=1 Tax=Vibrio sp. TaxID=678 RepID=UPI003AA8EE61